MSVERYSFEDGDGNEVGSYTTFDIDEAKRYASRHNYRVIANIYEYSDREVVADYTEPAAAKFDTEEEVVCCYCEKVTYCGPDWEGDPICEECEEDD